MKSMWIWIGGIAAFLIARAYVVSRVAEKEPEVVLWSDLQYGDIAALDGSIQKIKITEES